MTSYQHQCRLNGAVEETNARIVGGVCGLFCMEL
jgi:hypothetical protein